MGYIDKNLITDELVVYRARLHWIVLLKPVLITLVIDVLAVLLFYLSFQTSAAEQSGWMRWVGFVMVILSAIPIITAAVGRSSAEFAVTNKRVILKVGTVRNKTAEMFLNKIESVGVDQSIPGRILKYGAIVIRGTGGSLEPFDRVSAPLEFRRQIQQEIGKTFGPAARSASAGSPLH